MLTFPGPCHRFTRAGKEEFIGEMHQQGSLYQSSALEDVQISKNGSL